MALPCRARAIRLAPVRVAVLASMVAKLGWEMGMALARAAVAALVAARNPGLGLAPFRAVLLVVPARQARLLSKVPQARRGRGSLELVLSAELQYLLCFLWSEFRGDMNGRMTGQERLETWHLR